MSKLAAFISQFKEHIHSGKKAVVAGHVAPDGDTVGASFAMATFLHDQGMDVTVILDDYSDKFSFLTGKEWVGDVSPDETIDLFIACDCGSFDRLPERAQAIFNKANITVNIDHHLSNTRFAQINFVMPSSSTSEIVYEVVDCIGKVTKPMGEAIYLGILTDTGGFRFDSMTKKTFYIIGNLVDCGVDFSEIFRQIFHIRTVTEVNIFKDVLNNMTIDLENGICYSYVTTEEMVDRQASFSDLDGVVNYLLDIRGIHTSMLFSERPGGKAKISLRSNLLNVCEVAFELGGGGHEKAAAATMDVSLQEAIEKTLLVVGKHQNKLKGE